MFARCVSVARYLDEPAADYEEAHMFWLAAMFTRTEFFVESANLLRASSLYFKSTQSVRLSAKDIANSRNQAEDLSWMLGFSRFRGSLLHELHKYPPPADLVVRDVRLNNSPHPGMAQFAGLRELFQTFEDKINLNRPLNVWLHGGIGVYLYTGKRLTTDVDAVFDARHVGIPNDLALTVELADGASQLLYLDPGHNPFWSPLHPDHKQDALSLELGLKYFRFYVLSPLDLAVSKISRFSAIDQEDIKSLVAHGLVTAAETERRAMSIIGGDIKDSSGLNTKLIAALTIAKNTEHDIVRKTCINSIFKSYSDNS